MKTGKLDDMTGGWFVGNFQPAFYHNKDFEACVKHYSKGETEPSHFQRTALEITVIICGEARMGSMLLSAGDMILLEANEIADFEALTDVSLIALKMPSLPDDKVLALE